MSGLDTRHKAVVAITLLEHGMGLLTAATREAPGLDIGPRIAHINRQILALQGELLEVERTGVRVPGTWNLNGISAQEPKK